MFHRLFFYPTATFGRFPFQHLVMVPYKCKKRNMPNASFKTRTDKIRVCSEAGPNAISQENSDMEVHSHAIPSVMPSYSEGSAERLPAFCRGECNDTWIIFLFLGLTPSSCYCSNGPSYLFVHPSQLHCSLLALLWDKSARSPAQSCTDQACL